MFGITPSGFVRKDFEIIRSELETRARQLFGDDVDLSLFGEVGLFVRLKAFAISEQWKILENIYFSLWLSTAENVNLDRVVSIGGLSRFGARKAIVDLTFTGTNGTIIPVGFLVATEQGIQFATTQGGTISGGVLDLESQAVVAGTEGNVPSGSITTIVNPLAGVDTVTNTLASVGGAEIETDPELRQRYILTAPTGGSSSSSGIQNELSQINGVVQAKVFENITSVVDIEGRPPKSFEAVVLGGLDQDIGQALFDFKPAGIETFGSESVNIIDAQGDTHVMKFNRPTTKDIFVDYTITTNSDWKTGNEDEVKKKAVEYIGGIFQTQSFTGLGIGDDVLEWRLKAVQNDIVGIEDITVKLGFSASPTGTSNLPIGDRELARTDDTKIDVVTV